MNGQPGPRDATQTTLCHLFARVLQVPAPGIDDDFFALGGESVHVVTLISQIATTLGVQIPISAVFDHSTAADLAAHLTGHPAALAAGPGGGTDAPC